MSKRKKYIPSRHLNPIVQSKKLDKINERVDNFKRTLDALSVSHNNHIIFLGNFTRHDIKNAIQSMDSIVSTNIANEITDEHLASLKANIKLIRETMENFSQLVPYSDDEKFSLTSLINALELLNRTTLYEKKIEFVKELPSDIEIKFKLPFQAVLQMLNNMTINSVKSMENITNPQILIRTIMGDMLTIEIYDNGDSINIANIDKIFEYGYSTTGGSGIGLFHARYLCELFEGSVNVELLENQKYTKKFYLLLPIIKERNNA